MRVLALDVGDKRIGVAISDPTGTIASPLKTIYRAGVRADQQAVADLVREHAAERIVVGLPKTLRGELGPQAQKTMRFAQRLASVVGVPVEYWDERYSTLDAEDIVRARKGGRRRQSRETLDDVAAAVILQGYLDRQKREPTT